MLKKTVYWICTAAIAFVFISGGACYLLRVPKVVEGIMHLGYPMHFVLLLGMWKVLGGVAIVVPGFKTLKEWAYAGMFFDLTGAAVVLGRRQSMVAHRGSTGDCRGAVDVLGIATFGTHSSSSFRRRR